MMRDQDWRFTPRQHHLAPKVQKGDKADHDGDKD